MGDTCGPLKSFDYKGEKKRWICWHMRDCTWKWGLLMKQIWKKAVGSGVRGRSRRLNPSQGGTVQR